MARWLAIDWDDQEARYVLASSRGSSLRVEAAGAVPMPEGAGGAGKRSQLGSALQTALAGKAARAATLVGVDRGRIELVSLSLPPASNEELPELVRNQAMRENTAIADDAVLDFVPHGDDPGQPRQVTAVALSHARLDQIRGVLDEAGLAPQSIVLRPYATAELVLAALEDRDATALVISPLAEAVDLIVLSGGKAVFWRTLRQANVSHDAGSARRLLGEIQRTLVVAQPHTAGKAIAAVYLCGGMDEHPALVEVLGGGLPHPPVLVDPFALGGNPEVPEHPGRYSSLVGMLTVAAAGGRQAIDFLHPRRRPAPPDRRRTLVLAGVAAALALLFGGYHAWSTFAELDGEIGALSDELDRLDEQYKHAGERQKTIQAIGDWSKHDVNWLDELRDLSLRFPSGRDAVVQRMSLGRARESGGLIDLVGIVRDPVVVSHIEHNLRDQHHQISSRHMQERLQENNYSWHFESSIVVAPRKPDQYVSHLPAAAEAGQPGESIGQAPPGDVPRAAAKGR